MTRPAHGVLWVPRLSGRTGPTYRAIADALEADIRSGRLAPGDPLPTQRELAARLGVNFTTITRAYAEARRRGLLTATVGRGTFVQSPDRRSRAPDAPTIADHDLSVNTPPVPAWMPAAFRATVTQLGAEQMLSHKVLTYESRLGDAAAREAGVSWLRARGLAPEVARVVPTAGAQHALAMLLATLARPGETVLAESLGFPGLHGAAALCGVRLVGVEVDEQGLRPDMLDAACRRLAPKAIFCVPTLHNPTTAVMSLDRRQEIIAVARKHALRIVEDDICGPLFPDAVPLAALAPELVIYIGSLSKCVAPGLRTAFVQLPTSDEASRLAAAVRASILMLSPLPLGVACAWIADGTVERAVRDIRDEAAARGALAQRILGADRVSVPAGSLHAWLRLPPSWTIAAFVAQAQQQRVRVAPADWYVLPTDAKHALPIPTAVRLTLGAEPDRAQLERALRTLAAILEQPVGLRTANL